MPTLVEIIGYLASLFVLISFMMKHIIWLRTINIIGCGIFVIYGFMLTEVSWPIIITNVAIMVVNFYYLFAKKENKKA